MTKLNKLLIGKDDQLTELSGDDSRAHNLLRIIGRACIVVVL